MVHPNLQIFEALHAGKHVLYREVAKDTSFKTFWKDLDAEAPPMAWIVLAQGSSSYEFKLKPRMAKLGTYEVVAPLTEVDHGKAVYVLESNGTTYSMFYDSTDKEHQKLLTARSLFSEQHHAQAFHTAFIKMLALQ